ncbi:glycosyltransferase family 4 protein [Sphaerisporangium album]|uniref:glycosyltransferase family 4 protein n=1 Tax=Sphaerisporangium album TaxID=509200 RepID=UPI0015F0968B|nr:glycosyltransferase family 4 protein [Sphaerisporangium album]
MSRRDVGHPQAGDAERYLHRIARLWVRWGTHVTWAATRPPGAAAHEVIDGIEVLRSGEALGMYPRTVLRLLRRGERFDAVVDCTSRMAFAVAMISGRRLPVVQVVHDDSRPPAPAGRFSLTAALEGLLAGPLARWSRRDRAVAAPSASTRHELRRRRGFRGPIFVVPAGAPASTRPTGPPSPPARPAGGSSSPARPAAGPSSLTRPAAGPSEQGSPMPGERWERSARLLAGVVAHQLGGDRSRRRGRAERRYARSDLATLVRYPAGPVPVPGHRLRASDEVGVSGGTVSLLLNGCDEFDALGVLDRLGVEDALIRVATWEDLLAGPQGTSPVPPGLDSGRSFTGTSKG